MSMDDQNSQNANRDIFNIGSIQGDLNVVNYDKQPRSRQEFNARKRLLNEMRTELAGRKPLHQAAMLNLGKEQQPHQVKRPWDVSVKVGEQRSFQLPSEKSILEVFEEPSIGGKLLILGKAGSGKTTTLLELAHRLCDRAEMDSNAPIPVILELSSWQTTTKEKHSNSTIQEWILSNLQSKGVSKKVGEKWIRYELVLLLDGLDELPSEFHEMCVQAINQFLESEFSPQYLAVCSRKEEYENCEDILGLNGAVYLEDLSVEQIEDYFTRLHLEDLWESIKSSEKIVNFLRQPLFLAITSIAYQQIDIEEWRNCNTEERAIDYLLGIYRVLTISKDSINKERQEKIDNNRVAWLAKYMEESGQKEFIVRQVSPIMLLDGKAFFEKMNSSFHVLMYLFSLSCFIWIFQYHNVLLKIFRDSGFFLISNIILYLLIIIGLLAFTLLFYCILFVNHVDEIKMIDRVEFKIFLFVLIEVYTNLLVGSILYIKRLFKSTSLVRILVILLVGSLILSIISWSGYLGSILQIFLPAIASALSNVFFILTYVLTMIAPIIFTLKINDINVNENKKSNSLSGAENLS